MDWTWLPVGPWSDEPNEYDWHHEGVECQLLRGPQFSWCGYISVLKGHRWFGSSETSEALSQVTVHGGVTFAKWCSFPPSAFGRWRIGFDCAHYDDFVPGTLYKRGSRGIYRDFSFAKRETERLAEQAVIAKRFSRCNLALIAEVTRNYFETGADESDLSLLKFATPILTGALKERARARAHARKSEKAK